MKRNVLSFALVLAAILFSPPSHAAESAGSLITTSLLGASVGMLVGATSIVFTKDASKHSDHMMYGGGIGFLCGLGFGMYGMVSPSYNTSRTPEGYTERIYGIRAWFPLDYRIKRMPIDKFSKDETGSCIRKVLFRLRYDYIHYQ